MDRHAGRFAQALCAALLASAAPAALAKDGPQPGSHMLYKDSAGRHWCVTIAAVDLGVDAQPWAWFTVNDDVRRIGHVPVDELKQSCKSRVGAVAAEPVLAPKR